MAGIDQSQSYSPETQEYIHSLTPEQEKDFLLQVEKTQNILRNIQAQSQQEETWEVSFPDVAELMLNLDSGAKNITDVVENEYDLLYGAIRDYGDSPLIEGLKNQLRDYVNIKHLVASSELIEFYSDPIISWNGILLPAHENTWREDYWIYNWF